MEGLLEALPHHALRPVRRARAQRSKRRVKGLGRVANVSYNVGRISRVGSAKNKGHVIRPALQLDHVRLRGPSPIEICRVTFAHGLRKPTPSIPFLPTSSVRVFDVVSWAGMISILLYKGGGVETRPMHLALQVGSLGYRPTRHPDLQDFQPWHNLLQCMRGVRVSCHCNCDERGLEGANEKREGAYECIRGDHASAVVPGKGIVANWSWYVDIQETSL